MDNSQFRNLIQAQRGAKAPDASPSEAAFKKPALGSRARSSIPVTPRSVLGYSGAKDFARQVAEHQREQDGQPPTKKFKSSSAPKGTKLASGYSDRTLARRAGEEDAETQDDKEKRLKALEEMYKLQQIDETLFEKLKSEIGIGGSLSSTHLVKGLDWKLLEKARRGEDLNTESTQQEPAAETTKADVDEELDHVLDQEVHVKSPGEKKKESENSAPEEVNAQPISRDEILRRWKESRAGKQQTAPAAPGLGERFKKVTSEKSSNKKKFVEVVNGRRREVLVITNKDGTTKRKSRWIDPEDSTREGQQPLGMEVPAEFQAKQQALLAEQEEDEDDDIFKGVGDYDPLAAIKDESEASDAEVQDAEKSTAEKKKFEPAADKPRNYFATSDQPAEAEDRSNPITKDPTLLAALKRAAALKRSEEHGGGDAPGSDPDQEAKRQQLLAKLKERDRADAMDLDLGFGESRFGDDDDEDGPVWEGEGGSKKSGRKRGPKKRKGHKDNVKDVMAVMEGRHKDKS
ncbi:hypothetical protein HRR83_009295 [Exophiala dermatitidis]|uniref:RED-like N-terminal domain-containing protein n=1 Tax=Exophiala dermatitidis TaxID=5970 RepID=A0AAN6IQ95_EXODE|nr:hypothetical protein HRR75_008719 [Exophiala dermatitidis]KAJ4502379.1 hypothetical protein HRR73_009450 [Exophiala dermatitidis]KAJ4502936.1 hypothetical protein HRR74_009476 [Exophiala dermatitidis]KAJ4530398.1 hypothetical protein HRR76_008115 [Exophiala dermatitidis]KAJ4531586.1 hypothetical protein HRR77_009335 [Exophiala dermatitidis]